MLLYLSSKKKKVAGAGMPLGRDLTAARKAFSKQDIDALIASHDKAVGAPEDHAGDAGENRRWKERGCFDMSCSDKEYFCVLNANTFEINNT
jgi:hypothetical protein